jgi:hypothetical protein
MTRAALRRMLSRALRDVVRQEVARSLAPLPAPPRAPVAAEVAALPPPRPRAARNRVNGDIPGGAQDAPAHQDRLPTPAEALAAGYGVKARPRPAQTTRAGDVQAKAVTPAPSLPAPRGLAATQSEIRRWGLAWGARINAMGPLDAADIARVNNRREAAGLAPFRLVPDPVEAHDE